MSAQLRHGNGPLFSSEEAEKGGTSGSQEYGPRVAAEEARVFLEMPIDVPGDTYNLTPDYVNLEFDTVFAEPEYYRKAGRLFSYYLGGKVIGVAYNAIFTYTQVFLYYSLSLVLGLVLGLAWSLVYVAVQLTMVWVLNPLLKLYFVAARVVFLVNKAAVRSLLDPFFQAAGLMLSRVRLQGNLAVTTGRGLGERGPRGQMEETNGFAVARF